eukprot:CAMPEP_0198579752 /NCGR_PEP_ID=MMETSP1462-20131121/121946_1 /TAXON_ID=1333877 /ORGANISM="Brandtodinium nutriculum, Strain RCC3387" /LENGTH=76 /DNA_ID=CAMNT_0044311081 /DNA_START=42 /DNA_END=269 /DNA_ORIENTATION=-
MVRVCNCRAASMPLLFCLAHAVHSDHSETMQSRMAIARVWLILAFSSAEGADSGERTSGSASRAAVGGTLYGAGAG